LIRKRRRLNARFEDGSPEYPANTNCEAAKTIPLGQRMRRPLKPSWTPFSLRSAARNLSGTGTSWKTLPLSFNPESHNLLPHPLAIAPNELDQFIEPAGGLEERVGQVESEGRVFA
jgi:hypothetical protein